MKRSILPYSFILILIGCQSTQSQKEENKYPWHSESITKVFEAHGGYDQWSSMNQLSYLKGEETTVTNLRNRKIRLEGEEMTIGFDGENVWVTPDSADAKNARFYHNLFFYFYAMPFVVGDQGVFYEDLQPRELNGKTYSGIKISYGEGIGDSPEDFYIIWYDPETYKMEWLMYTVTYRSGTANENYSLLKYDQWQEFNRLLLPTTLQWHHFKSDTVGSIRREVIFDDIKISEEPPKEELFIMPEGAQIAPPPKPGNN